ncbi:hypothetical protein [Candidatus Binatus sp.]|uniref:hypothetical protein n=1 Tax=Candidatus Binatus sp. TaxID=2811406 RepID=UPI002F9578B4
MKTMKQQKKLRLFTLADFETVLRAAVAPLTSATDRNFSRATANASNTSSSSTEN